VKVSLDLQGWAELDAAFRLAPDIVRQEALAAVTEADQLLEREVIDKMPTATGDSRKSIFSREQALESGAIGVVGSAQPHIVYVELGTKPHAVGEAGVQALEDWARNKFSVGEKEAKRIAGAVAWKIRHHGTLGVGMFHRTWAQRQGAVVAMFERARDRIAARLAGAAQ
jgi:hypothetical protein